MKQTIQLVNARGKAWVAVEAEVIGPFALHPIPQKELENPVAYALHYGDYPNPHATRLTHIATGAMMEDFNSIDVAKAVAERLKAEPLILNLTYPPTNGTDFNAAKSLFYDTVAQVEKERAS